MFSPPVILALVPVNLTPPRFHYVWLQEYVRVVLDHDNPTWRLNTATVRLMQTDLLTIRVDLNGEER